MSSIKQATKQLIKRCMQITAARFGRHTRALPRSGSSAADKAELMLLMYHRVLPASDPRASCEEAGMMVTPETFRLHMSIIKQHFQVVSLSAWLRDKKNGKPLPPRACAITFDDGWADNYEFAYPVLKELELPATIFLVADMIGKTDTFWPERLSRLISTLAEQEQLSHPALDWLKQQCSLDIEKLTPTQDELSQLIADCKSHSDEVMKQQLDDCERRLELARPSSTPALLDWSQVNEMHASGLIEAGSHTCHHIRLTADKSDAVLQHEIAHSKALIEQHTGQDVISFCYPNGDYSEQAQSLVRQYYDGAVTTERGWNTAATDNYLLSRIGVHEDIANDRVSFLARVSGWM